MEKNVLIVVESSCQAVVQRREKLVEISFILEFKEIALVAINVLTDFEHSSLHSPYSSLS